MSQQNPIVALVGQPNCGKSTLFNRLTGSHQKVANYPGATVEHRSGDWSTSHHGVLHLIDLPGMYEFSGHGQEEALAAASLLGLRKEVRTPDLALVVLDATTIERSLPLVAEVLAADIPCVIALNMMDIVGQEGVHIDVERLSIATGVPVVPIAARKGQGLAELEQILAGELKAIVAHDQAVLERQAVCEFLAHARAENAVYWEPLLQQAGLDIQPEVEDWHVRKRQAFARAENWVEIAVGRPRAAKLRALSSRIDDLLLHPVLGGIVFLAVMFLVFQSVYTWSDPLIALVEELLGGAGELVYSVFGDSMVSELLVDAGVSGAGNVLVFLPQILVLFFWISILEESGYLARVAFILDRPMRMAGLSGRSFIPLLSSYACAVPGIMAARAVENPRTRLITIMVAPLMTCSARLPVYALILGAFVPDHTILGVLDLRGLVLFGLYAAGVLGGLLLAWILSRTVERGRPIPMILELPIYRWPAWRNVARILRDRSWIFVRRAGTVIFGMSVLLWFGSNFPRDLQLERTIELEQGATAAAAYRIEHSAAGTLGHAIEPVIEPLGFDWKIGVSLIASFAAREVMVAAMGTLYNVAEADETSVDLRDSLRADPVWDLPTAMALLIWYVFALQCMSTVAIMRRELNSWKWPAAALASTYGTAYVLGLLAYHVTKMII